MNQEKNQFSLADSETSGFEQRPEINPLTKQQKISLISLGVFTVLIITFGILQFRYNLYSPFDYNSKVASTQKTSAGGSSEVTTDLTKLDSDNDGLNDYDEVNVYKTSAYLEDSDSDGFSDKDEILNNTDPNCPAGQICTQVSSDTDNSDTIASPDALDSASEELSTEEQTAKDMLSGKSDPAVLRKLLLDNGMSQADLDKISDEELIASYQESLDKQNAAAATTETKE